MLTSESLKKEAEVITAWEEYSGIADAHLTREARVTLSTIQRRGYAYPEDITNETLAAEQVVIDAWDKYQLALHPKTFMG